MRVCVIKREEKKTGDVVRSYNNAFGRQVLMKGLWLPRNPDVMYVNTRTRRAVKESVCNHYGGSKKKPTCYVL